MIAFRLVATAAFALLLTAGPVLAQDDGDDGYVESAFGGIIREALTSGDLDSGRDRLGPHLDSEPEAAFGAGLIRFVATIEDLAQALYRHGLAAPDTGRLGPALDLPLPVNPDPESLDYAKVRGVLDGFVTGLDEARAHFEIAGASGDYVVMLDPLTFRIDLDGDGAADASESVGQVMARAFGMASPAGRSRPGTPPAAGASAAGEGGATFPDTLVGFDRADAIWLAGYSHILAAQADFLLAHDFSALVEATFHRLFPRAGLPLQGHDADGHLVIDPDTDTAIADAIALIHTLSWPVVEPDRLRRILERGKAVVAASRANWQAILAETDDRRELVPSPSQTPIVPEGVVTNEVVAAWHETLDTVEQVLEGELLVPHWRFRQGFDLKAWFESSTRTDIVMLVTGLDALSYLRDGPVASADSFAAANRVFGDNLLGYALWFN